MRVSVVADPESPVRLPAAPHAGVAGRGIHWVGSVRCEHEGARSRSGIYPRRSDGARGGGPFREGYLDRDRGKTLPGIGSGGIERVEENAGRSLCPRAHRVVSDARRPDRGCPVQAQNAPVPAAVLRLRGGQLCRGILSRGKRLGFGVVAVQIRDVLGIPPVSAPPAPPPARPRPAGDPPAS